MVRRSVFLVLLTFAPAAARDVRAFLGSNMQPEVVAHTLKNVENEWRAQAALFAECDSEAADSIVNCQDAPSSFKKSCGVAVDSLVQGSSGDKGVTLEYMKDICSQSIITGWHRQQCEALALALRGAMSEDSYSNRYSMGSKHICDSLWSRFLKEQQKRLADEKAATQKQLEEESRAHEIAEKKATAEAARKKAEEAALKKMKAQASAEEVAKIAAQKAAEAKFIEAVAKQKAVEAESKQRETATMTETSEAKGAAAPVEAKPTTPVEAKAEAGTLVDAKRSTAPVNDQVHLAAVKVVPSSQTAGKPAPAGPPVKR